MSPGRKHFWISTYKKRYPVKINKSIIITESRSIARTSSFLMRARKESLIWLPSTATMEHLQNRGVIEVTFKIISIKQPIECEYLGCHNTSYCGYKAVFELFHEYNILKYIARLNCSLSMKVLVVLLVRKGHNIKVKPLLRRHASLPFFFLPVLKKYNHFFHMCQDQRDIHQKLQPVFHLCNK